MEKRYHHCYLQERSQEPTIKLHSLTSVICKLLERIVVDCIIQHLTSNIIYDKRQHGFTKKRSTETNLLEALNIWSEAMSHHLPVDVIYLDLEKAFDKVPHHRLFLQLKRYDIDGNRQFWEVCSLQCNLLCVRMFECLGGF